MPPTIRTDSQNSTGTDGFAFTDDALAAALGREERLASVLLLLLLDLGLIAEQLSDLYKVDESLLLSWLDDRLHVRRMDGRATIVRRVFARGRTTWRDKDFLGMFLGSKRPAVAMRSYLWTILERNAQRLSESYAERTRDIFHWASRTTDDRERYDATDEQLLPAIQCLTDEELIVARLYFVDQLSQPVVAIAINSTRDRVQSVVARVREKLRVALERDIS